MSNLNRFEHQMKHIRSKWVERGFHVCKVLNWSHKPVPQLPVFSTFHLLKWCQKPKVETYPLVITEPKTKIILCLVFKNIELNNTRSSKGLKLLWVISDDPAFLQDLLKNQILINFCKHKLCSWIQGKNFQMKRWEIPIHIFAIWLERYCFLEVQHQLQLLLHLPGQTNWCNLWDYQWGPTYWVVQGSRKCQLFHPRAKWIRSEMKSNCF